VPMEPRRNWFVWGASALAICLLGVIVFMTLSRERLFEGKLLAVVYFDEDHPSGVSLGDPGLKYFTALASRRGKRAFSGVMVLTGRPGEKISLVLQTTMRTYEFAFAFRDRKCFLLRDGFLWPIDDRETIASMAAPQKTIRDE